MARGKLALPLHFRGGPSSPFVRPTARLTRPITRRAGRTDRTANAGIASCPCTLTASRSTRRPAGLATVSKDDPLEGE